MSNDWIKVEKTTPDKPEMMAITHGCKCTPAEAFLAWFKLWCYFDSATEDGTVPFMSACDADRIGTLTGLGVALERAKWLVFDERGCTVSHWERHNGRSAKRRALDAERKLNDRAGKTPKERPQNVRIESGQNADQSKSKRKSNDIPPPPFATEAFQQAWESWRSYRQERKLKPMASSTVRSIWKKMGGIGEQASVAMIEKAIYKGWQGLVFPDEEFSPRPSQPYSNPDPGAQGFVPGGFGDPNGPVVA